MVVDHTVKVGTPIWRAVNEGTLGVPKVYKGIVTGAQEDHFLYECTDDKGLKNVWGFYDENPDDTTCICFTTASEAKNWINKGGKINE